MNRIFSRLLTAVLSAALILSAAGCGIGPKRAIESNWIFESLTTGGKTTEAKDFTEDVMPMLIINKDPLNEGHYFASYRQDGKIHYGILTPEENGSYSIMFSDSDKEMLAQVNGSKLTLTIEGDKDTKISFKYTTDPVLLPVDDLLAPDYITAKMVGKGKVEITNNGSSEYMYGAFYKLEVNKDGKWYYAREKMPFAYTAIGLLIEPGQTNTEEYDLSVYGDLEPGDYRLAVGDTDACIYAEFTVNADGSYSYPD